MKHMKKSMLITTVMMVVLLVVALSTATFAWYTSSNTVNTEATNVSSAESSGANIAIGWEASAPVGSSRLTFAENTTDYNPMVPTMTQAEYQAASDTFTLKKDSLFHTSNMSFGELTGLAAATPYIGADGTNANVFYIVNYSTKATKINFSINVVGENAARLRVAIFNEATGACVATNASLYFGLVLPAEAAKYTAVAQEPANWSTTYMNYSSSDSSMVAVLPVAPTYQANTYYNNSGALLTSEPVDWATSYANYSSVQAPFTAVVGVAPAFATVTVYEVTAAKVDRLSAPSTQVVTKIDVATTIALSDGVTGVAQGFIVKAWFDGPTQVDAFGGKDATFAITAQASAVI